jgi:hypothetical protein
MNRLARLPIFQIEPVEIGFFPGIYIRDGNVEDIRLDFNNAHGGLWKCEEKLGPGELIVRKRNIPKLLVIQDRYED